MYGMGANTYGCSHIEDLEYGIFGDAIFGDGNNNKESTGGNTTYVQNWEETALRFMDRLNTSQYRGFIAAMVLFSVSFFLSLCFISCFCFKKQRARIRAKRAQALVTKDVYAAPAAPKGPSVVAPVVDFVRSTSKKVMEKVAVVATGASVAVGTAAAAAIAHVSSNLSVKYGAEEESENTEYENMEENDAAASTDGSYKAPEAPEPEDVKKVKSTGGEDKPVTLTNSFLGMFGIGTTEKKDEEKEEEEPVNTPPVADDTKEVEGDATKDNEPITLSSQMDDYFNHKFV
jgi:hypothetical protein